MGPPCPWILQGLSTCSSLLSPGAAGDPCQDAWSTSSRLPLSSQGSQGCSSHFFPHSSWPGSVLLFLTQTAPRHRHGSCGAGPCPVEGPLEPTGTARVRHGAPPAASHSARLCLGTCTQYEITSLSEATASVSAVGKLLQALSLLFQQPLHIRCTIQFSYFFLVSHHLCWYFYFLSFFRPHQILNLLC